MPMTIVVTRNVPDRYRGFLASCMCEIAPGVYTAPRMNRSVRERVWAVMCDWWQEDEEEAVLMTWPDANLAGGQQVKTLGLPRQDLQDHHGVFLACREVSEKTLEELAAGPGRPRPRPVADESSEDPSDPSGPSE